jgi:hypothetical protein
VAASFAAEFPDYFDDHEWEYEAKGYFADLTVRVGDRVLRPTFYDRARFLQEVDDAFAAGSAYLSSPLLVLVPVVTRAAIMAALEALAAGDFADLMPA